MVIQTHYYRKKEDTAADPADPAAAVLLFCPRVMGTNHKPCCFTNHPRELMTPIVCS